MSYMYVIEPGHREKSSVMDAAGIYRQEEAAEGGGGRKQDNIWLLSLAFVTPIAQHLS